MPARRLALAISLAAAALPAAGVPVASAQSIAGSKRLWATINYCDTTKHPNAIGIRASMPGVGRDHDRMYMRFQMQYFQPASKQWINSDVTTDSGFRFVGSAKWVRRESGWDFKITPPPAGQTYRLRGIVTFEWRRGAEVVRRARRQTRSGHPGTYGADPKSYSSADCTIRP